MWIEGKGEAQQPPRPDQQAAEAVLRSHGIAVLTQYDDVGLFLELHLDDPVAPRAMRRLAKQASAVLTQAFGGHLRPGRALVGAGGIGAQRRPLTPGRARPKPMVLQRLEGAAAFEKRPQDGDVGVDPSRCPRPKNLPRGCPARFSGQIWACAAGLSVCLDTKIRPEAGCHLLSRNLRDFTATAGRAAYPFGEPRKRAAAFQSIILLRSFCLSVSGAVAPSAPDLFGPVSPAGIL